MSSLLQNGGVPNPFPEQYLQVITPAMEKKLNENRRKKAEKAALKSGKTEAEAAAAAAAVPPVVLSADRKTIQMSNGAAAGYAFADRDGHRHGRLVWTTVHGAPAEQFDRIRHKSVKGEKKGTKPLSLNAAKAAFTRYYKNREFKSPRSRQAAMQMDLNYAPANDEDIVTTKRYLRNPGRFDYKGFDDSTGPRSKFYDPRKDPESNVYDASLGPMELHRRKAHPNPRTKAQLAAQWPVREFQEQDKEGRDVTVRHRVSKDTNERVVRQHKRSHRDSKKTTRRPGQSVADYEAELAAKNAQAKAKRESVKAARRAAQQGGHQDNSSSESEQEEEQEQRQQGGRAVSLKTAVRLLRSYYNNKYNKN